jgi:hypothetical protein
MQMLQRPLLCHRAGPQYANRILELLEQSDLCQVGSGEGGEVVRDSLTSWLKRWVSVS